MSILEAFTWCCELQTELCFSELFRHGHPQSKIQWSRSRDRSPFWIPLPTNRNEKSAQISVVKKWHRNRYMKHHETMKQVHVSELWVQLSSCSMGLVMPQYLVSWCIMNGLEFGWCFSSSSWVPLIARRSGFEWEPEIFPCRTLRNRLAH